MGNAPLTRTTFEISRTLEFFTERELQMQIGFPRWHWAMALTKELLDNALDACETAGVSPNITLRHDRCRLTVQDNGRGLPLSTLERSLDYLVRVSDKAHYVSTSRGQLGNALKCVWAAPYVLSRHGKGCVTVATSSGQYQVEVELDHLAQQPKLTLTVQEEEKRKTGTAISIDWPEEVAIPGVPRNALLIIRATIPCPSSRPMHSSIPTPASHTQVVRHVRGRQRSPAGANGSRAARPHRIGTTPLASSNSWRHI